KLAVAEAELIHLYQQKQGYETNSNETTEIFQNSRNLINAADDEIKLLQKNKEQVDQQLTEIKDRNNELKLQLSGLKERLDIEFKQNIDELLDKDPDEKLNREELDAEVAKMKKR